MTRHGSHDDEPHGCMPETRENILEILEGWAGNSNTSKVYWLKGMAGTGKSSIAHSLCEILDKKGKLGGSFFCSRSDTTLRDPKVIVPTIAGMLARSSPSIQSELCQVLEQHPDAAAFNSLTEQFNLLLARPIENVIPKKIRTYKIIVIDAIDECSHQEKVASLIETICDGVSNIPLKFFISSRSEAWIEMAFSPYVHEALSLKTIFPLHDVAAEDVRRDIKKFLKLSLSKVAQRFEGNTDWPSEQELKALLDQSGRLFIYAATAVRYIRASNADYRERLAAMTLPGFSSSHQTGRIDSFYNLIMEEAFGALTETETARRRGILSTVIFLQTPLSIQGMVSLLVLPEHDIRRNLRPFQSVIHVPSANVGQVSIFHTSFRDFMVGLARSKYCVDASESHHMLANNCLQYMNRSLRHNICNLPEDTVGSRPHVINDINIIPEALQYACLYWAYHLAIALERPPGNAHALCLLSEFAGVHLLHWFVCLSAMGQLESGVRSLRTAYEAISVSVSYKANS